MSSKSSKEQDNDDSSFPAGSISNPEDGVVSMLEDFFYFEDPLTERVEQWATNQPRAVLDSFSNEEHQLTHTQLHVEYQELFEHILTEYLEEQGFSSQQFYAAATQEEESITGKRRKGDTFSAVVMAASDFDAFCEMMNDVRQGHGVAFCPPLMSASENEEEEEEEAAAAAASTIAEEGKTHSPRVRLEAWPDEGKRSSSSAAVFKK